MLIFWFRGRADHVSVVALPKSNLQSALDSRIVAVASGFGRELSRTDKQSYHPFESLLETKLLNTLLGAA